MATIAQRLGIELVEYQTMPRVQVETFSDYHVDPRLLEEGEQITRYELHSFKISDEDAYDVLSVCDAGNALYLMSKGVQSAQEARKFLLQRNAALLKRDNSELASEMLRRRIPFRNFLRRYSECLRINRHSDHLADGIEYRDLHEFRFVSDSVMLKYVLDGSLSLPLLKELGVEVAGGYVGDLFHILDAYSAGTTTASLDDIRRLLTRCEEEKSPLGSPKVKTLMGILKYVPYSEWEHVQRLTPLVYHYEAFFKRSSAKDASDAEKKARCAIASATAAEATDYRLMDYESMEFFEAGVDLIAASRLMQDGLSVQQAMSVLKGQTVPSVASGWL